MSKKNTIITLFSLFILFVATIIFYACQKEEPTTKNNNSDTGILKSSTNEIYLEQIAIEANNIIVDFLLRSKEALNSNLAYFEQVCKNGNTEELINLIGYNRDEDIENSTRLFEIAKEIATLYELEELSNNPGNCSSCALEFFPETLLKLNYDDPEKAPAGWVELLMCLHGCALECSFLAPCPECYAACVAACTAICYYLSSAAMVSVY